MYPYLFHSQKEAWLSSMNLEPEDIISNWTCSICRVPETYDSAMHLWAQNLQNEMSFLVNIDYMVVFKCYTCGTAFHGKCLVETNQMYKHDIPLNRNYTCGVCRGRWLSIAFISSILVTPWVKVLKNACGSTVIVLKMTQKYILDTKKGID